MTEELRIALSMLLINSPDQKRAILLNMLWRLTREDWHGVSDDANDLRELHL